jgi:hypothetical protein
MGHLIAVELDNIIAQQLILHLKQKALKGELIQAEIPLVKALMDALEEDDG